MSIAGHPSSGNSFTSWTQWSQRDGGWIDKDKWASGDFNGDGKTDIAAAWNNGGSNSLTVRQSNGSRFAPARWATNTGGWSPSAACCVGQFPHSSGASDTYNQATAKARYDSMCASLPAGAVSETDNQRPDSAVQSASASSQPLPKALGRAAPRGPADPNKTMCDYACDAKARNSPAAPGLERQCLAGGGSMAPPPPPPPPVAAPAPAPAPVAAPDMDALAAVGAAIAQQDPEVAEARSAEAGAFYQLGFDIASGLFGDPALGSAGNMVMDPDSEAIRNSLSAAGQRGFNASAALHLARDYKH